MSSGVSGHRDSLASVSSLQHRYQKPSGPRSLLPASALSAAGNAAVLKRALSDVAFNKVPKHAMSSLQPLGNSIKRVLGLGLGPGATVPPITTAEQPSPGHSAASSESPSKENSHSDGFSSKKEKPLLLSLTSRIWSSVSALGSSLKITRSTKVVPSNSGGETIEGEKFSSKTDGTSPNGSPMPSQRANTVSSANHRTVHAIS